MRVEPLQADDLKRRIRWSGSNLVSRITDAMQFECWKEDSTS
jgi:hypothetical protein